ncbi:MAG: hypothetical protein ABW148_06970 [Sedimenticola sp.]
MSVDGRPPSHSIICQLIDALLSTEKTLADCFKLRNKIGMDVVLEAFKLYKSQKKFNLSELLKEANICWVEKVIRPTWKLSYEGSQADIGHASWDRIAPITLYHQVI